jgi:hypothetical protein
MAALQRRRLIVHVRESAPGFFLALALAAACAVRLPQVLASRFPLNDGGLFFTMARDLQANRFILPWETSYNAAHLPFAYPPLSIYLVAGAQALTGLPLEGFFSALPVLLSLASIAAFHQLSASILRNPTQTGVATLAFALLPSAYSWHIMGGGVTRALGQLFMLLGMWQGYRVFQTGAARAAIWTALLGGLTALTHPEAAWFLAQSLALMWLFFGRTRRGTTLAALIALAVVALSAPWWVTQLARFGPQVFSVVGQSGAAWYDGLTQLLLLQTATLYELVPVLTFVALIGVIACLARREFFLPVWLLSAYLIQPRAAGQKSVIILALLVGVAAQLWPATRCARFRWAGAALLLYLIISNVVGTAVPFQALSSDERAAMAWVRDSTPKESAFVIAASDRFWGLNRSAEWFPVLAQRPNLALVQGYEWAAPGVFAARIDAYEALRQCLFTGAACVDGWMAAYAPAAAYLYVPQRPPAEDALGNRAPCCASLTTDLRADDAFAVAYDGPGATIFRRRAVP